MARPEINMNALNLDRERRAKITVQDIRSADAMVSQKEVTANDGKEHVAPAPDSAVENTPKTSRRKAIKAKSASESKVVISCRIPADVHAELTRIAALHGQPQSYTLNKVLAQWMARSQDKREEILSK